MGATIPLICPTELIYFFPVSFQGHENLVLSRKFSFKENKNKQTNKKQNKTKQQQNRTKKPNLVLIAGAIWGRWGEDWKESVRIGIKVSVHI